jgi:pseudouridine 5'-phosphatase
LLDAIVQLVTEPTMKQDTPSLWLERPARAVIFDMDGVLLDTEPIYTEATQTLVGRYGKQYTWDIKRQIMGRDPRFGADVVIQSLGLPLSNEEFQAEMARLLATLMPQAQAMPGAERLVRALHERGVPIALATSSGRLLFGIKSARHPWFSLFDTVVCGDDGGLRYKPAPDIFLAAASRLGCPPEACVVFEDSLAGVEAALNANMQVVALLDPRQDRAAFRNATRIIGAHEEISPAALGFADP